MPFFRVQFQDYKTPDFLQEQHSLILYAISSVLNTLKYIFHIWLYGRSGCSQLYLTTSRLWSLSSKPFNFYVVSDFASLPRQY